MTWGAIVGGTIAAGASVYGSNQASKAAKGGKLSLGNMRGSLSLENEFRPIDYSPGLLQLVGQSAYGLGSDPDSMAMEFLIRQAESSSNPEMAHRIQNNLQRIQALSLSDPATRTPQARRQLDSLLKKTNALLVRVGGGGQISMPGGRMQVNFADAGLQDLVTRARQDSESIRQNRLNAQKSLAQITGDFPTASAGDLDRLTADERVRQEREINDRYKSESERILTSANTSGWNPAGVLSELEKNRSDALFDTQFTAADRALQVLGGRQTGALNSIKGLQLGLSPDTEIALLNALRNQQTPTTGQLAAAQIGAGSQSASAASQALSSGYNQAGQAISTAAGQVGAALRDKADQAALDDYYRRQAEAAQAAQNRGPGTGPP